MINFILRWQCYPGLPGGPDMIKRVCIRGRQDDQSQKRCDDRNRGSESERDLKMGEGALSQGMPASPEDGRRKEMICPPRASGNPHSGLSETILDSDLQGCKKINGS